MKKFRYSMQNILEIQQNFERQAKNNYAMELAKLHEEEDKLVKLKAQKAAYEQETKKKLEKALNIREIRLTRQAMDHMDDKIREQVLAIHVQNKNVEERRKRLEEIMIDRKTHEKLKEKAFQEYLKEMNAEESREIDQLVSFLHSQEKE